MSYKKILIFADCKLLGQIKLALYFVPENFFQLREIVSKQWWTRNEFFIGKKNNFMMTEKFETQIANSWQKKVKGQVFCFSN